MYRIYEEPTENLKVGKFYEIKRQNFIQEFNKYCEYKPDEIVYGCFVCKNCEKIKCAFGIDKQTQSILLI
jgi:hypothetical protein